MSKRKLIVLGVLVLPAVWYFAILPINNPLRRSRATIAAALLEETPVGTSMESVRATIQAHGWLSAGIIRDYEGPSISVCIGGYESLFHTRVLAVWIFDEQKKLVRIHIDEVEDAL